MKRIFNTIPLFLFFTVIYIIPTSIYAIEVYRADFESQGVNYPIDIGLYNNDVEFTVANFHKYLDGNFYNNLLINRSVPGFVIQGGAYTFDDTLNDTSFSYSGDNNFNGGLQPVLSQGAVANEFRHSNTRGTLAMAKMEGAPDSATSEWFINLTDNSFLDDTNGGFTVFGRVLNGLNDIDLISNAPVHDLSSQLISDIFFNSNNFAETPLNGFSTSSTIADITKNNLIIVNNFTALFELDNVIDFVDAAITIEKDITIKNNNITPLEIGTLDTTPVLPPFSVTSDLCNEVTLEINEQCIIKVKFTPPANTAEYFYNEFNIDMSLGTSTYNIPITLKVPSPKIIVDPVEVNYGFVPLYNAAAGVPEFTIIRIKNYGDKDLNISSIDFQTATPAQFAFFDNCTTENNEYFPGIVRTTGQCFLVMHFKPTDLDIKNAEITIVSNDPVSNTIVVPVSYGANTDTDGITSDIEKAASNNGDGNNDGTPDYLQSNVVSFNYKNSPHITLIVDKQIKFTKTTSIEPDSLPNLPGDLNLGYGAFSFELTNVQIGGVTEFGIILEQGESPSDFYLYGSNFNDPSNHWYKLDKNTTPGVNVIGNATIPSPSGPSINRNLTTVSIVDGGLGDNDLTANGTIVITGGPIISNNYKLNKDTSGAAWWSSILIFIIAATLRMYNIFARTPLRRKAW